MKLLKFSCALIQPEFTSYFTTSSWVKALIKVSSSTLVRIYWAITFSVFNLFLMQLTLIVVCVRGCGCCCCSTDLLWRLHVHADSGCALYSERGLGSALTLSPLFAFFFLQWKRKGTGRSPAAETALRSGSRSPGRPGRPSLTTSWRSWSAASSGRSTWASRTAWSWRPPSTSPTRRSRPGTRIGGEDTMTVSREGGREVGREEGEEGGGVWVWFLTADSWLDGSRDAMFSSHHHPKGGTSSFNLWVTATRSATNHPINYWLTCHLFWLTD